MAANYMNLDLKHELRGALDPQVPFETNLQTLRSLKERGAKAEDVQAVLETMFQEAAEERIQDHIADLLDCVVGWCAPQYALWKEQ
jgi:hypothetical protein